MMYTLTRGPLVRMTPYYLHTIDIRKPTAQDCRQKYTVNEILYYINRKLTFCSLSTFRDCHAQDTCMSRNGAMCLSIDGLVMCCVLALSTVSLCAISYDALSGDLHRLSTCEQKSPRQPRSGSSCTFWGWCRGDLSDCAAFSFLTHCRSISVWSSRYANRCVSISCQIITIY